MCRCHDTKCCLYPQAIVLSCNPEEVDVAKWLLSTILFSATPCRLSGGRGGGPVLGWAQGGGACVFSFMEASSCAFCSLYILIFRWRL